MDITNLKKLTAALALEHTRDAITPSSLAGLLDSIIDVIAQAASLNDVENAKYEARQRVTDERQRAEAAEKEIKNMQQSSIVDLSIPETATSRDSVQIKLTNSASESKSVTIPNATTKHAGIISYAQCVRYEGTATKVQELEKRITSLEQKNG